MRYDYLAKLDAIVKQQGSAVLLADSEKASELAMQALGDAGEVYHTVKDMFALEHAESDYAVTSVINRLKKISTRRSILSDAVAGDNIRLAIRQLRRLVEPETADTEPIDIFIFNS